ESAESASCSALCYIAYRDLDVKAQFLMGMPFSVPEGGIATGNWSAGEAAHRRKTQMHPYQLIRSRILSFDRAAPSGRARKKIWQFQPKNFLWIVSFSS